MFDWLTLGWDLSSNSYLTMWFMGTTLALLGIPVVAREQVLLGAGLVQAGTLGVAIGVALNFITDTHAKGAEPIIAASVAIMAASLLASHPPKRERPDAIAGWLFLAGSSGSVLLIFGKPVFGEVLSKIQSSSILYSTGVDAVVSVLTCLVTVIAAVLSGRRVVLAVWDADLSRSLGLKPSLVNALLAVWTGLVLAVSLQATGALFTTAMLVLPALLARRLVPSLNWMPWAAVAFALIASTAGMGIAFDQGLPPAQVSVGLLVVALLLAWTARALWTAFAPARTA